jgi:hypothetical protein
MKHCHRPMVPSELPILVLFCGRAGTHLIDMTNGRSVREYRERPMTIVIFTIIATFQRNSTG